MWERFVAILRNEPARLKGLVAAVLGLAIRFGAPLSPEQQESVEILLLLLLPLLLGEAIRGGVTPTTKVQQVAEWDAVAGRWRPKPRTPRHEPPGE